MTGTPAPVVTLRTTLSASRMNSSGLEANQEPTLQKQIDRYSRILEKLQVATAEASAGVLVTVPDRDASLLQSCIADGGESGPPLPAGGLEAQFGDGLTGGDVWGWIRSLFDHIDRTQWHPIVRPCDDKIERLADTGRIRPRGHSGAPQDVGIERPRGPASHRDRLEATIGERERSFLAGARWPQYPLVKGEEEKFGPHGYLTLDFDGPSLIERVHV